MTQPTNPQRSIHGTIQKVIALAEATEFPAEREAALHKAHSLAVGAGIGQVMVGRTLYLVDLEHGLRKVELLW